MSDIHVPVMQINATPQSSWHSARTDLLVKHRLPKPNFITNLDLIRNVNSRFQNPRGSRETLGYSRRFSLHPRLPASRRARPGFDLSELVYSRRLEMIPAYCAAACRKVQTDIISIQRDPICAHVVYTALVGSGQQSAWPSNHFSAGSPARRPK